MQSSRLGFGWARLAPMGALLLAALSGCAEAGGTAEADDSGVFGDGSINVYRYDSGTYPYDAGSGQLPAGGGGSQGGGTTIELFGDGGIFGDLLGGGGGSSTPPGGSKAGGDGGADACKDQLCFDVFDCYIFHPDKTDCGFSACEGFVCK